ncbi:MAG: hypothetical protein ACFE0J_22550 [Elainellaceae cyanobacterium]
MVFPNHIGRVSMPVGAGLGNTLITQQDNVVKTCPYARTPLPPVRPYMLGLIPIPANRYGIPKFRLAPQRNSLIRLFLPTTCGILGYQALKHEQRPPAVLAPRAGRLTPEL